jgi:myogenesis-regulating glycosidase
VCSFNSPQEAQLHAITNMFGHPTNVPDELMFRQPIWSTWARYKVDINESLVMQFAQEIIDNGFSNSQIEIDDDWETCYGELEFSSTKFPDPKGMVDALKQMGYRVTLWVHPFINSNCPRYNEYLSKGYFVKDLQGNVKTKWWNGDDAAAIDLTNEEARTSFFARLISLREQTGLDGYKFDAGESGYLPQVPDMNVRLMLRIYHSNFNSR